MSDEGLSNIWDDGVDLQSVDGLSNIWDDGVDLQSVDGLSNSWNDRVDFKSVDGLSNSWNDLVDVDPVLDGNQDLDCAGPSMFVPWFSPVPVKIFIPC